MPTNIDELLAMEAKATPGEWEPQPDIDGTPGLVIKGSNRPIFTAHYSYGSDADAVFVAALRNAAPGLLAELRETRAALAAWMAAKEARKAFWQAHADDLILHDGDEALALDDAIDAAEEVLRGIGEREMSEIPKGATKPVALYEEHRKGVVGSRWMVRHPAAGGLYVLHGRFLRFTGDAVECSDDGQEWTACERVGDQP
jgi:hypothetical protein